MLRKQTGTKGGETAIRLVQKWMPPPFMPLHDFEKLSGRSTRLWGVVAVSIKTLALLRY